MAYRGFRQAGVEDEAESLARLLAAGANGGPAMPGSGIMGRGAAAARARLARALASRAVPLEPPEALRLTADRPDFAPTEARGARANHPPAPPTMNPSEPRLDPPEAPGRLPPHGLSATATPPLASPLPSAEAPPADGRPGQAYSDPNVRAELNAAYRAGKSEDELEQLARERGVIVTEDWLAGMRRHVFGRDNQGYGYEKFEEPFVAGPDAYGTLPIRPPDAPAPQGGASQAPVRESDPSRADGGEAGGRGEGLGSLSREFETGGRGAGTVSDGRGDPGGVSYGSYQLASRHRMPQLFLASEGGQWAEAFRGLAPGSAAFSARWREIAAREPEAFEQAQHDFIRRTHYDRAVDVVARRTGLDADRLSIAARNAIWSASVQHGSAPRLIARAVESADRIAPRGTAEHEQALINGIYDRRAALVGDLARRTRNPAERRNFNNILTRRYPEERRRALEQWRAGQVPR